jgi:hypothetical protein
LYFFGSNAAKILLFCLFATTCVGIHWEQGKVDEARHFHKMEGTIYHKGKGAAFRAAP